MRTITSFRTLSTFRNAIRGIKPNAQGMRPYQVMRLYQGMRPYQCMRPYQGMRIYQGLRPYQCMRPYQGMRPYQLTDDGY
jgi:hypothetical protein